jgi:hypothetical protein
MLLLAVHFHLCYLHTAESSIAVQHILNSDMDKFVLSDLKNQLISFSDVNKLVKERYELKVEVQHYSSKVQKASNWIALFSTFCLICALVAC